MRDRIFNSVDLPAPLRPMMPTRSPLRTSKLTSRRAQKSSVLLAGRARRANGCSAAFASRLPVDANASRRVVKRSVCSWLRMYFLPRPSAAITTPIALDDVREGAFCGAEISDTGDEENRDDGQRQEEAFPIEVRGPENCPTEPIDDADHRIHRIKQSPLF